MVAEARFYRTLNGKATVIFISVSRHIFLRKATLLTEKKIISSQKKIPIPSHSIWSQARRSTVILQIFGVVLFSVFSVVNDFTEIKKTPKCEKHIEQSRQQPRTPKFKQHRTLRRRSLATEILTHRKFVKLQYRLCFFSWDHTHLSVQAKSVTWCGSQVRICFCPRVRTRTPFAKHSWHTGCADWNIDETSSATGRGLALPHLKQTNGKPRLLTMLLLACTIMFDSD